MNENWQVGQKVTIHGHGTVGPVKVSTVARVLKTKVVLADGSEWDARRCRPWSSRGTTWYTGPNVYAYKDGDERRVEVTRAHILLRDFDDWGKLSDDDAVAIAAMIRQAVERSKQGNA